MTRTDLKNRRQIKTAVDNNLADALKDLSKRTQIPQSRLLDQALKLLFEKYGLLKTTNIPKDVH